MYYKYYTTLLFAILLAVADAMPSRKFRHRLEQTTSAVTTILVHSPLHFAFRISEPIFSALLLEPTTIVVIVVYSSFLILLL